MSPALRLQKPLFVVDWARDGTQLALAGLYYKTINMELYVALGCMPVLPWLRPRFMLLRSVTNDLCFKC